MPSSLAEARVEEANREGVETVGDWCEGEEVVGAEEGEEVQDQLVGEGVEVAAF